MLGSFLSFCSNETKVEEILSTFWLFYSTAGATGSAMFFFLSLLSVISGKEDLGTISICPLVFLILFVGTTYMGSTMLINWWKGFFHNSVEVITTVPSNLDGRPLPLPDSQARMLRRNQSVSHRIISAIQSTPRALIRMSSTYFQPAENITELKRLSHTRTRSEKCDSKNTQFQNLGALNHKRAASTAVKRRNISLLYNPSKMIIRQSSDSSFTSKACVMCCENSCNAVLMECGHGGLCYDCSLKLWKAQGICHMCRNEISQVLQIEVEPSDYLKVISTTKAIYEEIQRDAEFNNQ